MSLRVAFYSHNGFGLGHLGRNLKLARALLGRRPNADVLVITGAAAAHGFPWPDNVDYVKLPTVRKQGTGRWRPQSLDIEMEHLLALRRTIIREAVRAYRPHLFVADFLPLGVEGELIPALEELAARPDARSVVGFRDILDDPAEIRAAWARDGIPDAIESLYDRTLVYGEPDWFDFAAYGLPAGLPHYVGLLGETTGHARTARNGDIRLIASCGGGADGYATLAATLEAAPLVAAAAEAPVHCLAVTGPLMPEPDVERLRAVAARTGGRVRRYVDDLKARVARSTAVVGMAGYNTVCEVLSYRRPAVLVPRSGPSGEQPLRARILADRGLATALPLNHCTAEELARSVAATLAEPGYPDEALPSLGGVDAATTALLDLVS